MFNLKYQDQLLVLKFSRCLHIYKVEYLRITDIGTPKECRNILYIPRRLNVFRQVQMNFL